MPGVFISYRREESAGEARALFNELGGRIGEDRVFMDVDGIASEFRSPDTHEPATSSVAPPVSASASTSTAKPGLNAAVTPAVASRLATPDGPLTSIGRARVNVTLGTQAAGTDRCLGGTAIVPCADRPAQTWILEPAGEGALVRIHNESSGMSKCLDVVNDGINNKLAMVACGDYTGQKRTFEAAGSAERFMKVRNEFTGPDRCLAAPDVNGRSELRMVKCVGAAPQRWQVAPR